MSKYHSITIRKALEEIQSGHYLLPAFQRDFVWKHEQVELLFDSLMRGYPISSMLFWKLHEDSGRKYRFYRFISSYTEKYRTRSEEVKAHLTHADCAVLDGQQRLTALNIGLNGTYAYRKKYAWERLSENNFPTRRLYLDISRRYEDDDDGREYRFEFLAGHDEDLFYDGGQRWLRVGLIGVLDYDGRWAFTKEHDLPHEQVKIVDKLWDVIWKDETISYYEEETDDPDVAVDVFSRINSGGTRLPLSDILMAMTVANWKKDAKKEIGSLVDDVNHMGFYIGGDYVLKAMLYLFHSDVRFRIGNFDNDFISECEREWEQVSDAIRSTFALVRGFGLDHGRIGSYYATLPLLYHLYWSSIYKGINTAQIYQGERLIMKRWLLKSILLRTFGYRSDTALRGARRVLEEHEWPSFPVNEIEHTLRQTATNDDFFEQLVSCQYDSRQAWAVLSLLYSHFMFEGMQYDIDHIHPRTAWNKDVSDWNIYNSVLNLQILPKQENIRKGTMPFAEWVDMKLKSMNVYREMFLHSAYIPDVDLSVDNFQEFAEERKKMLIRRLREEFSDKQRQATVL